MGGKLDFDPGRTESRFRTTQWTLIRNAKRSPEALGELLIQYWSPIYAFFRKQGRQPDDARDDTQEFLAERVERVIQGTDEARSFRSYLIGSLKNFLNDRHRHEKGRKPGARPRTIAIDAAILERVESCPSSDPIDAASREYARNIVDEVYQRIRAECLVGGLALHWQVYEMVKLAPARSGNSVPSHDAVAHSLGIEDAEKVSSMKYTIERKLEHYAREVVSETVSDPAELDAEFAAIRGILRGQT